MNIYKKIQQARVELQKMGIKKSGHNKFANFDYFELKDFLPKVNEIFLVLKLFSKFDLLENEGVLTIINSENPEESIVFSTPKATIDMKGQNGLQQIGSTHTYLKRYCYYNALEIIINDEIEATIWKNDNKNNSTQQNKKAEPTEAEVEARRQKGIKAVVKEINKLSTEKVDKLNFYITDLTNMSLEEIQKIYNKIKKLQEVA